MTVPSKTYTYDQKWGAEDPFVKKGYAQIPSLLFEYGARILLEPDEAYLICHILRFKYSPSDEGPSEKKLAELIGKSDDTIRKLLHRLVKKGFLFIERTRGDLGYYTHTTYNFSGLRDYLNECHYLDHPQERPTKKRPLKMPVKTLATPQLRGVVRIAELTRETPPSHTAKEGGASPQSCGTLKTLIEKEDKEEVFASLSPEQKEPDKEPASDWRERHREITLSQMDTSRGFGKVYADKAAKRVAAAKAEKGEGQQ